MAKGPNTLEADLLELRAAMARLTQAAAWVDNMLVYTLAEILRAPKQPADLGLASILIFGQASAERRADLVRQVLTHKLGGALDAPKHTYEYKLARFLLTAFNKIWSEISPHLWIRNTAAHGDVMSGNPPTLIPSPFDVAAVLRFNEKRGVRGGDPLTPGGRFFPDGGFTAEELHTRREEISASSYIFDGLIKAIRLLQDDRESVSLDEVVAGLGMDLRLKPPLQARPPRQAKPKGARKGHNPPKAH